MTLLSRLRLLSPVLALVGLLSMVAAAQAQEYSESHLKAARSAMVALKASDQFDAILPGIAQDLQAQLTAKNPDLEALIGATVQEKALELVGRRSVLEGEVARVFAKIFTEEELNAITAFYNTDAGRKMNAELPIVTREMAKAAEIWQRGLARDLAESVGASLEAAVGKDSGAAANGGKTE